MIKDITELNFPKHDGKQYATLSQATVNVADMGEKTITTRVKIDGTITPDFSYDWAVEFKGEKYVMPLRTPQASKENTSLDSTIDLTFQHWAEYQLKRWPMFSIMETDSGTVSADKYVVPINLNLEGFCELFAKVLFYYYADTITIDLNPDWESKKEPTNIQIDHTYMWDLLIKVYELFAVRWQIEPAPGNDNKKEGGERYVIKVGYPTTTLAHIFEQGFDGGLLKVERQVQDEDIRNMLLGRGGGDNLPYRYFKDKDNDNDTFPADPDWVPELANIYFSELRGATFRSYIQGWKARHYGGTATKGNAYAPWAWEKGNTDLKFNPIEYVKDDKSIRRYGPLLGGLDNNDDIYPTIQGVNSADHPTFFMEDIGRIDQVVDVEQILSDKVVEAAEADSRLYDLPGNDVSVCQSVQSGKEADFLIVQQVPFSVEPGRKVNLDTKNIEYKAGLYRNGFTQAHFEDHTNNVQLEKTSFRVYRRGTGEVVDSIGISEGDYYYDLTVTMKNNDKITISICVSVPGVVATSSAYTDDRWNNTFDIWIKNIWGTTKRATESNEAYAERVWLPILGDHLGGEAKVVFSSGMLSTSEDYEFVIPEGRIPQYDPSRSLDGVSSHWKITVAKSDADLESLGLYVPSTKRQGKAGDYFYFTGIELPHQYILWAEEALDNYKYDQLLQVCDIKPTWVVTTDRVKMNNMGEADALISQLRPGCSIRLADKRFITVLNESGVPVPSSPETLYLQSLKYTYREPTSDDAALNPDVEIVLSDKYETTASPVATLSGEVSAIGKQLGAISNVEQLVRAVGDKLYLRKDGIPDRSVSPTEFSSLLTSYGFRQGMVGGTGWGFFRDASGAWVIETDKINIRQDLQVNNLVINQITARGGMIVESAAAIEVIKVGNNGMGDYVCYFDQKNGSVANLFRVDDIGYCACYSADNEKQVRYYKRVVLDIGENYIVLAGDESDGEDYPVEGDVIVQWGNISDPTRQFVIVRDVINGGYERFIEGLGSIYADGQEYYFIGRQAGMYGDRPRFYLGDSNGYIEYVNGQLNIKARLSVDSEIGDKRVIDFVKETAGIISPAIIDLTNEVQGLACDSSGNVVAGLPATTYVYVYQNGVIQTGWTFSFQPKGCLYTFGVQSGELKVTSVISNVDDISVGITASKPGYDDLHATFSLYKSISGKDGASVVMYELGLSENNISKDVNGTLSTSAIVVTKYKVDASGRQATTDKWLKYSIERESAMSADILLSSNGGSSNASINLGSLPSDTKALVVTLYDGSSSSSAILDRERIPIITDASGLMLGGTNMLSNTNQGVRGWTISFPAREVDETTGEPVKSIGEFVAVKSDTTRGLKLINEADSADTGWQLAFRDLPITEIVYGNPYILSFRAKAETVPVRFGIQLRHTSVGNYITGQTDVPLSQEETRYEIPIKITKSPDVGVDYKLCFYILSSEVWSEIELWDLKLELGNIATEWSPAPEDFDYLTEALAESTVVDGGLVLTSLIKVGTQTDPDTLEQKTMAGISGLVESSAVARGGIAVWAGGDMSDLGNPNRDTSVTPATTVIRHDGSAYFANNTIRFAEDVVEVGDNVVLNKDGLVLHDSKGSQRLKVSNTSVGEDINIDAANIPISGKGTAPSCKLQLKSRQETIMHPGTGGMPGTLEVVTYSWWAIVEAGTFRYSIPGTLTPGATITLRNCSVEIDPYVSVVDPHPLEGRARFRIGYFDSNGVAHYLPSDIGYVKFMRKSDRSYVAELQSMYIPASNITGGNYFIEASLATQNLETPIGVTQVKSASVVVNGTAYNTFESTTVLGNDGLLTVWDKVGLLVNKDKVVIRAGDMLLRVSSSGIAKSSNGGSSWSSL